MAELPKYKSDEYYPQFSYHFDEDNKDYDGALLKKFIKDGELTADTPIKINKYYKDFDLRWHRKTLKGTECIYLGRIKTNDVFLEFMEKFFLVKKEWLFFSSRVWINVNYGVIKSICGFCSKDTDKFKEIIRKAEKIDEVLVAAIFAD